MVRTPGGGYGFSLDMIGEAIQRYAVSRLKQSGPWAAYRTIKSIERYFFGATKSQLATIKEKGEMAFQAGNKMTGIIRNINQVPRAEIPVDTTLPKGVAYRIKVLTKGTDPLTGAESYRTITVDYARNPTAEMIKESISNISAAVPEILTPYEKGGTASQTNMQIDRVISMVRRTY